MILAPFASRVRALWWNITGRDRVEGALTDELNDYVDLLADEHERAGVHPEEARRRARVEVGGIERVKESTRDAWLGNSLVSFAREIRHAVRSLARSPGYVIIAIATLGLGIGGATAVFSVIDAVLFRPLAGVREPERLVSIERVQGDTTVLPDFGYPDYDDLRKQSSALSDILAYTGNTMSVEDRAGSGQVLVHGVSGNFFDALGVRPMLGRVVDSADVLVAGTNPIAVLSYAIWLNRFAGDSSVIGSTLRLNGALFTVVGVTAPGFSGAEMTRRADMWVPLTMMLRATHGLADDALQSRSAGWLRIIGRLAPGKNAGDAQRDLSTVAARLAAAYPTNKGRGVRVSADARMLPQERANTLRLPRLLAAAIVLLLLIACANVATLSLIRGAARRREFATRLALGASRARVIRASVLEGTCIAAGAAIAGLMSAYFLVHSATAAKSLGATSSLRVGIDMRVLAAGSTLAVMTALLVSLAPALQSARTDLAELIKDGAGGAVRRRSSGQRALVGMQIALSLVLLSGAATLDRAFRRVIATNPGFEPAGLAYAHLRFRATGYDDTKRRMVQRAVLARAAAEPSLAGAALTSTIPPQEWSTRVSVFRRGEEPPPNALLGHEFQVGIRTYVDAVSPEYFSVMHTAVVLGRAFSESDDEMHSPVVIVSRHLAALLWPHVNPVGQFLAWPLADSVHAPLEVIGVAEDTRHAALLAPPPPLMYVPIAQQPFDCDVIARGRGGVAPNPRVLASIVGSIDSDVPVTASGLVEDHVRAELYAQRTASAWLSILGGIALLLATVGLYGIVARTVLQRTRELAVRAAIGAVPRQLFALVLGDGLIVVGVGTAFGLILALAGLRILHSSLMPLRMSDVVAVIGAAALLGITALRAPGPAARRAVRLDPTISLRSD
jgi:macrolide transport system ATP-binding/permease protein